MENKPEAKLKRKQYTFTAVIVAGVILAFFMVCAGIVFPVQGLFYLVTGWFTFLYRVSQQITVSASALVTSLVLLILMLVIIQLLGRYVTRLLSQRDTIAFPIHWQFRWTCAVLVLVVITFTGGFAVVGVAQLSVGLVTAKKAMLYSSYGAREPTLKYGSLNNLRNVSFGIVIYSSGAKSELPSGIISPTGQPLHSWETQILPFLDAVGHRQKIDDFQPWNSKRNAKYFKESFPVFIIPGRDRPKFNTKGYGLSYYSLNSRVFYPGSVARLDQIPDGTSSTIMGGEVFSRVRAWGDPINFRDPALGINKHIDGFGAPWKAGGARIIFLDGSARFINNEIDPAVLKALSTPNGGEPVGEF